MVIFTSMIIFTFVIVAGQHSAHGARMRVQHLEHLLQFLQLFYLYPPWIECISAVAILFSYG